MVNAFDILKKIQIGLNTNIALGSFIIANEVHNLPSYPYTTISISSAYIRDKDDIRGTISQEKITDQTKVKINRSETPKMVFSFNCYSDNLEEVLTILKDTVDYLTFKGQQYLQDNDIIILECSTISDRTTFMEVDYKYQWGFDCTIRTDDTVSMTVDTIDSVEMTNELNNEIIEI